MTDPLDTVEAIIDQQPAEFGNWTAVDMQAAIHAREMLLAEWEAFEPGDRTRFEQLQRVQGLVDANMNQGRN